MSPEPRRTGLRSRAQSVHGLALSLVALGLAVLAACSSPSAPDDATSSRATPEPAAVPTALAEPLEIGALSPPVAWLAHRLGGDDVVVDAITPPGADPRVWQPTPEAVVALHDADLLLAHGAGFEAWLDTASLPRSRLVLTSTGLDLLAAETMRHSHGDGGEHSHTASHVETWLDPDLLLAQAERVAEALLAAAPDSPSVDHEAFGARVESRLATLRTEIDAYRSAAHSLLTPLGGQPLGAAGPHYAYLGRSFGLELVVLELSATTPADGHARHHLDEWLATTATPLLFWPETPSDAVRAALPDTIHHVIVDPLSRDERRDSGRGDAEAFDLLRRAHGNLDRIRDQIAALGQSPTPENSTSSNAAP
ncbi:MAG: metal ABC transporter substrate-binding protein [Acidobacteriota bacterium]